MNKDKAYYEGLDKRTNEYKDWKAEQTPELKPHVPATQEDLEAKHKENPTIETEKGLGDIVETMTKATGIKAVVDYFTPDGKDCGCTERKEKMNKLTALKNIKSVECLTLDEYNFMKPLLSNNEKITGKNAKRIVKIYYRIFNLKGYSSCVSCSFSAAKLDELKAVLKTYEQ